MDIAGVDWNAILRENLVVLSAHHFPTATYTAAAIRSLPPFTVEKFCEAVKIFTAVEDKERRCMMVNIGTTRGDFLEARTCTVRNLIDWCSFLKTDADQTELRRRVFSAKLEQQKIRVRSASMVSGFNRQMTDLSAVQKKITAESDARIAKIQRKIAKLRARMETAIDDCSSELEPAGSYEPMSAAEFKDACLKVYRGKCAQNDFPVPPITADIIEKAKAAYGAQVRDVHKAEFLRNPNRKAQLIEWTKKKITVHERNFDTKAAETLRRYLAAMGGGDEVGESVSGGKGKKRKNSPEC